MWRLIITVLLSRLICGRGERRNTEGKEFLFAFFPTEGSVSTSQARGDGNNLFIASGTPNSCNVSVIVQTIQLNAGMVTKVKLPASHSNESIHIKCLKDVSIYCVSGQSYNSGFTAIPVYLLSNEYLVPGYENNSFIGLVGTQNNSYVELYIRSTCSFNFNNSIVNNGDSLSVVLNTNEVLQIGPTKTNCDLGGTFVNATEKISVFSGASAENNTFVLQTPPIEAFDTHVIAPGITTSYGKQNILRVLAGSDHTNLFHPGPARQLMRGDFVDFSVNYNDNVVITSDKPVLVTQTFFYERGAFSTFLPGVDSYRRQYFLQGINTALLQEDPHLTIVSQTSETKNLRINEAYPNVIKWNEVKNTPYSVGRMSFQATEQLHITSSSGIFVREDEYNVDKSQGYIGGFSLPERTEYNETKPFSLQCLPDHFFVKILSNGEDLQSIFMGQQNCFGTLQEDFIIFNVSYKDCATQKQIMNGNIYFTNMITYALPSKNNVIRNVQWEYDIACSQSTYGKDSVIIYPKFNGTNHLNVSGQIQGSPVSVTLYNDSLFNHALRGSEITITIGSTVYVQVEAPHLPGIILVVKNCSAHTGSSNTIFHQLIENGCARDAKTKILVTRNQITRFQFEMFDLPHDDANSLHVTCDATFCDQMDFSEKCQQSCP